MLIRLDCYIHIVVKIAEEKRVALKEFQERNDSCKSVKQKEKKSPNERLKK